MRKKEKRKHDIYLFGHPIKEYLPILFLFSLVWSMSVIVEAIGEHNHLARFAFLYLGCSFGLYYYSNISDKEEHSFDVSRLNKKIRMLEISNETKKTTIELLEQELEKTKSNSLHH